MTPEGRGGEAFVEAGGGGDDSDKFKAVAYHLCTESSRSTSDGIIQV